MSSGRVDTGYPDKRKSEVGFCSLVLTLISCAMTMLVLMIKMMMMLKMMLKNTLSGRERVWGWFVRPRLDPHLLGDGPRHPSLQPLRLF